MHILFVCTGNTCRSPMAAFLLREKVKQRHLHWSVESAGIFAVDGQPISALAVEALHTLGVKANRHQSQPVQPQLLTAADYVFTMTQSHANHLVSMYPDMRQKIHPLGRFLAQENGEADSEQNPAQYDIVDPFGGSKEDYLRCAAQLNGLLDNLIERMTAADDEVQRGGGMKIIIGSDHAGVRLKRIVLPTLQEEGFDIDDIGTFTDESVDYPDYALQVAEGVANGTYDRGILICGTGLGMCISANKVRGVRAVTVQDEFSAEMARRHNDANVLTLGERVIGPGLATAIIKVFLTTEFEGGRHSRRVDKITKIERDSLS